MASLRLQFSCDIFSFDGCKQLNQLEIVSSVKES